MEHVLSNKSELDYRIFEIPTSAVLLDGKRINYFRLISSLQDEGCNAALKRVVLKIDLLKIDAIIDDTPYISELQKTFYKTMLHERKARILDYSLGLLRDREEGREPVKSATPNS